MAALVACDDTGLAPTAGLEFEDMAQIALQGDLVTGGALLDGIAGFDAPSAGPETDARVTDSRVREFTRERRCPAGGGVVVTGTIEKVAHGDGVVEHFIDGDGTQTDCSYERRRFTLTLNGEFTIAASRKTVNGEPVGPQTTTKAGWFDWVKTDADGNELGTGRCQYELTSVRHPDSGKRQVTGFICDRQIDRSVDWDRRG
jgi:hypothetical protein